MKRTEAKQIGDIINGFIQAENLTAQMNEHQTTFPKFLIWVSHCRSQEMNEHKASYVWPDVVGHGINRYTISRSVSGGVMTVRLSSATLRNELMMNRTLLIKRINEAVGAEVIKEMIFK